MAYMRSLFSRIATGREKTQAETTHLMRSLPMKCASDWVFKTVNNSLNAKVRKMILTGVAAAASAAAAPVGASAPVGMSAAAPRAAATAAAAVPADVAGESDADMDIDPDYVPSQQDVSQGGLQQADYMKRRSVPDYDSHPGALAEIARLLDKDVPPLADCLLYVLQRLSQLLLGSLIPLKA